MNHDLIAFQINSHYIYSWFKLDWCFLDGKVRTQYLNRVINRIASYDKALQRVLESLDVGKFKKLSRSVLFIEPQHLELLAETLKFVANKI